MNLDYSDVLKMKKAVDEVFHINVHFHDSCGGQYFSLDDKPSEELKEFIVGYFGELNINVNFSEDSKIFVLNT